jgi:hypothetical protein
LNGRQILRCSKLPQPITVQILSASVPIVWPLNYFSRLPKLRGLRRRRHGLMHWRQRLRGSKQWQPITVQISSASVLIAWRLNCFSRLPR